MKKLIALLVAFTVLPCQRSQAPVTVTLGLAFKCLAIGFLVPTAIIIYRCDQDHFLVRYQSEGEEPWWAASQASVCTLRKQDGRRCEGPWPDPKEPTDRAWANNMLPSNPPFPCGPLGTVIFPNTNALRIVLQMSAAGTGCWTPIAEVVQSPDDNYSFAVLLKGEGTNGMTAEHARMVQDCDSVCTNAMAAAAVFRIEYRDP